MFSWRKHHDPGGGASPLHDRARSETEATARPQWHAWRRSAQKVTRSWQEWLAAERAEGDSLYRRYVTALVEEEHAAAELQRVIDPTAGRSPPLLAPRLLCARLDATTGNDHEDPGTNAGP